MLKKRERKLICKMGLIFTGNLRRHVAILQRHCLSKILNSLSLYSILTICRVLFPFHVEGLLEPFVWQWLHLTDAKVMHWVEQAIRKDTFTVRGNPSDDMVPEEYRHSVSAIDVFRSFNQVVEQLIQLEWDDDLQYAKFMTALSKSISNGVARYCESLEKTFAKEMDRLSPEQEAAMTQTAQEKLMQFAKDAWTNKDKIEPFQFFPEVCFYLPPFSICIHN